MTVMGYLQGSGWRLAGLDVKERVRALGQTDARERRAPVIKWVLTTPGSARAEGTCSGP